MVGRIPSGRNPQGKDVRRPQDPKVSQDPRASESWFAADEGLRPSANILPNRTRKPSCSYTTQFPPGPPPPYHGTLHRVILGQAEPAKAPSQSPGMSQILPPNAIKSSCPQGSMTINTAIDDAKIINAAVRVRTVIEEMFNIIHPYKVSRNNTDVAKRVSENLPFMLEKFANIGSDMFILGTLNVFDRSRESNIFAELQKLPSFTKLQAISDFNELLAYYNRKINILLNKVINVIQLENAIELLGTMLGKQFKVSMKTLNTFAVAILKFIDQKKGKIGSDQKSNEQVATRINEYIEILVEYITSDSIDKSVDSPFINVTGALGIDFMLLNVAPLSYSWKLNPEKLAHILAIFYGKKV